MRPRALSFFPLSIQPPHRPVLTLSEFSVKRGRGPERPGFKSCPSPPWLVALQVIYPLQASFPNKVGRTSLPPKG